MLGQVHPDTNFGKFIIKLASNTLYNTFLDIGTWNGRGTTLCLVNALNNRPKAKIYSIDANKTWHETALKNWPSKPDNLELIWGTLSRTILTESEIRANPLFPEVEAHFNIHYKQDCIDTETAPIASIPSVIDVVIMDGGEFCGEADLAAVQLLNPLIICMCDTNVIKNSVNLKKLLDDKRYVCLENNKDSKNGWAVFSKVYLINDKNDRKTWTFLKRN